jgi:hypothetical protein
MNYYIQMYFGVQIGVFPMLYDCFRCVAWLGAASHFLLVVISHRHHGTQLQNVIHVYTINL